MLRFISRDYINSKKQSPIRISSKIKIPLQVNFLDFKFLFSLIGKIDLLKIESQIMQKIELTKSMQSLLDGQNFLSFQNIYLDLKLNRNNILEDTLKQL